MKQHNSIY